MENGVVSNGTAATSLSLEGNRTVSLSSQSSSLLLHDPGPKTTFRSACKSISIDTSGKKSIPLYNVIWVEVSNGHLIINYAAQPSKSSVKLEEWRFPLANQGETHDEAAQAQDFAAKVLSHAYGDSKPRKRVYVLINPHAGPGGALRKWNAEVKPLFKAAKMSLDEVVLERGGQAAELVERVDVDKYDTIMACSGDGTPHEIFNGLARRADAARALSQVAVSHIPCGSGNAMSCNLYGSHRPSLAALAIIKGVVTSLDLVSITQGDKRFVSFLSQALGIIAESDLATENLRWMGGSRFEVGVMMRLFRKKCYPCDLAVKVEYADKTDVKAHYKRHASDTDYGNNRPAEEAKEAQHGPGLPELKYGTVQDDLPEGWELVQYDKVGNFYCGNMAYMTSDANFFSAALASDGCMDLVMVDGDLSPVKATKLLFSVESGKFFDNEDVTYKKVSAYRIIPRDQKDGYISIDGERVPFEPFQAEVHQGLGRVISKRGIFEAPGPLNWDKVTVADRIHA